jgi:hypothetical protein
LLARTTARICSCFWTWLRGAVRVLRRTSFWSTVIVKLWVSRIARPYQYNLRGCLYDPQPWDLHTYRVVGVFECTLRRPSTVLDWWYVWKGWFGFEVLVDEWCGSLGLGASLVFKPHQAITAMLLVTSLLLQSAGIYYVWQSP